MMLRLLLSASLLAAPVMAQAQEKSGGTPPDRIRSIMIKKGEPCPKAEGNEVVVCSTNDEPYRLPKQFRESAPPANRESWVRRVETMDQVSRKAGGLPDTCSSVGTGGQTGCTMEMLQAWSRERRAAKAEEDAATAGANSSATVNSGR